MRQALRKKTDRSGFSFNRYAFRVTADVFDRLLIVVGDDRVRDVKFRKICHRITRHNDNVGRSVGLHNFESVVGKLEHTDITE